MSRAAVYDALSESSELNQLGITEGTLFANWSLEEPPYHDGPFAILRWESEPSPAMFDVDQPVVKNVRQLTVWVHYPIALSTDFNRIDSILNSMDSVMAGLEHSVGSDGETVTCVRPFGRSPDFKDESFQTISRNAVYQVLSRKG